MELTTRVDRLEDALARLAAADARAEARFEELAAGQAQLVEAQRRTEEQVAQLVAGQAQLVAGQAQLVEAQRRTEEQVAQLAAGQAQLVEAQRRTEEQLRTLLAWQQGERGRHAGERYERHILRRALVLFDGGAGGTTEEDSVRRRLRPLLQRLPDRDLPAESDPTLADLLWWKGGRVAVVEVSRVVDENDVDRAFARAATLRRAGEDAMATVIGNAWDDGQTQARAAALRLQWKVGDDVSEGYIAFHRLPDSD